MARNDTVKKDPHCWHAIPNGLRGGGRYVIEKCCHCDKRRRRATTEVERRLVVVH